MMLLQQRDAARRQRRMEAYWKTREQLRSALADLIPGREIIVFGSLTRPGVFHGRSDVDLALPEPAADVDGLSLAAELTDRLNRPVDVVRISRCRFREKLLREGEQWIV